MGKQCYYYQFAQGSYSDYSTGGLFMCDHEVAEEEWKAHYEAYRDELNRLSRLIPYAEGKWGRRPDYESAEYKARREFEVASNPEESFAKLHNMVALECSELWRDC